MNISYTDGILRIAGTHFNPQLTLIDSAQVFHWKRTGENEYRAVVAGKKIRLLSAGDDFLLTPVIEEDILFWHHYFDLGRDYASIAEACTQYPTAQRAMQLLPGLRVLNQPTWEVLISFIISANNNVSRIRSLIEKLINTLGDEGALPTPEQLSSVTEEMLRSLSFGYRAPYLIKTAQMVLDGFQLDHLKYLPYEEAHRQLLSLPGVGDKVADCVQLFGTGHSEAFPIDVWVERLMKRWFLPDAHGKREISRRAHEMFGKNAGIIQQSLFHCARLGLIPLE